MSGLVAKVTKKVPKCCDAKRCRKGNCGLGKEGLSGSHVLIDMDCAALKFRPRQKRCDYVFIGEHNNETWVAPIELKGGNIGSVSDVAEQLEGGAKKVAGWLSQKDHFEFSPILAHRNRLHRKVLKRIQARLVKMGNAEKVITLLRCGRNLKNGLHY